MVIKYFVFHLLFTNDSLFYFRAMEADVNEILRISDVYEKASGKCINFAKYSAAFSSNTNDSDIVQICDLLGIKKKEQR